MGAAATLVAAADKPDMTDAIVSIDGWTDHALGSLESVNAPTLLIAGQKNTDIVMMNESAFQRLTSLKRLELVGGVADVLTNHDALDKAAHLTADWLQRFLRLDAHERE
jgi:pimeloyl-ACP methyl ester carboxylesterase